MVLLIWLVLFLLVVSFLLAGGALGLRAILQRYSGGRPVTCPETHQSAVVGIDARHAAATVMDGSPALRLCECSQWPVGGDCGGALQGGCGGEQEADLSSAGSGGGVRGLVCGHAVALALSVSRSVDRGSRAGPGPGQATGRVAPAASAYGGGVPAVCIWSCVAPCPDSPEGRATGDADGGAPMRGAGCDKLVRHWPVACRAICD
jgi:hypothetical protein